MILTHISGFRFLAPIGSRMSSIAHAASRVLGVPCHGKDVDHVSTSKCGRFVVVDVIPMPTYNHKGRDAWVRSDLADGSLRVAGHSSGKVAA